MDPEIFDEIATFLRDVVQPNINQLSSETLQMVRQLVDASHQAYDRYEQQLADPPVTDEARRLWTISGADPRAFAENLLTASQEEGFAQTELGQIARSPDALEALVSKLQKEGISAGPIDGIPGDAQLLWVLAGGDENAFMNYLMTYDTEETRQLRADQERLWQVVESLRRQQPTPEPRQEDGVPSAPLQSSNVFGSWYDPTQQLLVVRFHNGSVYRYNNVPEHIAEAFQEGAATARTDGKNEYGRWWEGKRPSLGAAVWQHLREGGYPYQRVA